MARSFKIRTPLLLCLLLALGLTARAQDPHFSQYASSPAMLNPGMTGLFKGNYRITGVYRNQWSSILDDNSFKTYSVGGELRLNGVNKYDAIGLSAVFFKDVAGEAELSTQQINFGFSYIKSLSREGNQYLSLGLQGGNTQRSVNQENLRFGNQYVEGGFNEDISSNEQFLNETYSTLDFSGGLMYYYSFSERSNIHLGAAAYHLYNNQKNFLGEEGSKIPMRFNLNAGASFEVSPKLDLVPSLYIAKQGPFFETTFGAFARTYINSKKSFGDSYSSIFFGSYYRLVGSHDKAIASDALVLATKVELQDFHFGLSYDINISELSKASRYNGALELTFAHMGAFSGARDNVKFCPKF